MNVTYRIRLFTGFVVTWATRRVPYVEQDLLTLPEHLRSPLDFGGVRVAYFLVFYVVSCVLFFVCLSFSFLVMALSVYFRFMSLTVPLVLSSLFYKIELDGFRISYLVFWLPIRLLWLVANMFLYIFNVYIASTRYLKLITIVKFQV